LLYFGLPQVIPIFKNVTAYSAAIIGLSLNSAAYMSETIRASIVSVDKGQMEASLSVGMTHWQGMKRIVLPQAARVAIPSLANNFIDLIKGSSLAFTIGVAEIMAKSQMNASATYRFFESYLAVAIIYWITISFFSYLQKLLERKLSRAY
jgi:putative amino-acid transport system permease protein